MAKFDVYWKLIQETAQAKSKAFFMHDGVGRPFETEKMEGQDLSGWLVPLELEEEFAQWSEENNPMRKWDEFITFAIYEKDGEEVSIRFQTDF